MRLLTLFFGVVSIAWGIALWRQSSLERLASGIIDRNGYKSKALALMMPEAEAAEQDPYCRPEATRSAAVLRM
jgi:hypothetical protein